MSDLSQSEREQALLRLKMDYAWRWFSLHAKQRVTMFNYFLVASGILANAYGVLLREELYGPGLAVAIIGSFACLVSVGLDKRNHRLVKLGEDVLREIEQIHLFQPGTQSPHDDSPDYGILYRDSRFEPPWFLTHKRLIRALEWVGVVGFLGAALYAAYAACQQL